MPKQRKTSEKICKENISYIHLFLLKKNDNNYRKKMFVRRVVMMLNNSDNL